MADAAPRLGVAVHTKIYPIIYAPALYLYVDSGGSGRSFFRTFFSAERLKYTAISAGTFLAITAGLYTVCVVVCVGGARGDC